MIVSAAHEVAHSKIDDGSIHGDSFVVAFGDIMRQAMNNSKILNRIWKG
jgi:hypothetical protein